MSSLPFPSRFWKHNEERTFIESYYYISLWLSLFPYWFMGWTWFLLVHCSSSSICFSKLLKDYLRAAEKLKKFWEKREASANGYEWMYCHWMNVIMIWKYEKGHQTLKKLRGTRICTARSQKPIGETLITMKNSTGMFLQRFRIRRNLQYMQFIHYVFTFIAEKMANNMTH